MRLKADGITHTWDANGNLLHDGVYTYTYDYENRLTAVSNQVSATSFEYNGLGDRYRLKEKRKAGLLGRPTLVSTKEQEVPNPVS